MEAPGQLTPEETRFAGYKRDLELEAETRRYLAHLPVLLRLGCCPRCSLRFCGVRNYAIYREDADFLIVTELFKRVGAVNPQKYEGICVACFGVLSQASDQVFLESIFCELKTSGYDFSDYSLSVTLPASLTLRQYSIWLHLCEILPETFFSSKCDDVTRSVSTQVVEVKECLKWLLGHYFKTRLDLQFRFMSDFRIQLVFRHPETANEPNQLLQSEAYPSQKKRKSPGSPPPSEEASPVVVSKLLQSISLEQLKKFTAVPPTPVYTPAQFSLSLEHCPVFLAGRYIKYSRDLSQTPWIINGERITPSSIEELIANPIMPAFRAKGYTFSSAGREDVDVRMLGRGRPFVLEISDPHRVTFTEEEIAEMQQTVNKSTELIQIRDLQIVSKSDITRLKEGEETKRKTYRCIVWVSRAVTPSDLAVLDTIKDLTIQQRTPVRVLHRRSLAMRPKVIHKISYEYINPHFLQLDLTTQAGTYIKEFIHGDLGRTTPNLGTLLNCEADILQLDVLSIDLDFPPALL